MLRGLAIVVIIAACGIYGLLRAQRYTQRPKQLRAFHQVIAALNTEISFGATPLPQGMRTAAMGTEQTVASFFTGTAQEIEQGLPAQQAWQNSVSRLKPELALNEEDWQVVINLGKGLGTTDKVEEKKKLDLCSMRLLSQEEQAAEQGAKLAKLWSYMGFLAGATIVLIIL